MITINLKQMINKIFLYKLIQSRIKLIIPRKISWLKQKIKKLIIFKMIFLKQVLINHIQWWLYQDKHFKIYIEKISKQINLYQLIELHMLLILIISKVKNLKNRFKVLLLIFQNKIMYKTLKYIRHLINKKHYPKPSHSLII